ncbi:MAG TPA: ribose-phosphate pyrophosphokinase [Chloroflexota bacterium]|nr:ribose-phosphate pyrophosphokinase [Chloroflexota bacterium]
MHRELQVFTGNANPALAREITDALGIPLGRALVGKFRNGETRIRIEDNVRGADVFVVQPTCKPTDHNIIELLLMIDALKRASANRITAVIPYYGYAKQEKKTAGREPISAKLVANLITTAGADRVLAIDLHAPAIEGFFDIPVDHLRAGGVLAAHLRRMDLDNPVVVSPDAGGVLRANEFRERVGASLAIIAKQRPRPDVAEALEMVGDVRGKTAVLVDDLISTGGTAIEAARLILARGAHDVYMFATHAAMTGEALELIQRSPLRRLVVTNTIPLPETARNDKIEVLTVAPLLAETIKRIHEHESVSALFT